MPSLITRAYPLPTRMSAARPKDFSLLIWDAPNVDMTLGRILGGKPVNGQRPRFDHLSRWLEEFVSSSSSVEGVVFLNVEPVTADHLEPWVRNLRECGLAVFAKPKTTTDSDVDEDMVAYATSALRSGKLRRLVIASHDGRCFRSLAETAMAAGTQVIVLGFAGLTAYAERDQKIEFVDLASIPGLFSTPLPEYRTLSTLPAEGLYLAPFKPIVCDSVDLGLQNVESFLRWLALDPTTAGRLQSRGLGLSELGSLLRRAFDDMDQKVTRFGGFREFMQRLVQDMPDFDLLGTGSESAVVFSQGLVCSTELLAS